MSHFCVLVVLPRDTSHDDVEDVLDRMLAPYQENNMGDCPKHFLKFHDQEDEFRTEYTTGKCERIKLASGELKSPYDDAFDTMRSPGLIIGGAADRYSYPEGSVKIDCLFSEVFPTFEEFARSWHGHDGPDEETGRYGYWENPNAKWDWWSIGGRWTGALVNGYDPEKDPKNIETCRWCAGTGKRSDAVAEANPALKERCNGCLGTGQEVKWPTQWAKFEGDVRLVKGIRKDFTPYAAITPDGEWHASGDMGWFGISRNEKGDGQWATEFRRELDKYTDHIAVIVDCHI